MDNIKLENAYNKTYGELTDKDLELLIEDHKEILKDLKQRYKINKDFNGSFKEACMLIDAIDKVKKQLKQLRFFLKCKTKYGW